MLRTIPQSKLTYLKVRARTVCSKVEEASTDSHEILTVSVARSRALGRRTAFEFHACCVVSIVVQRESSANDHACAVRWSSTLVRRQHVDGGTRDAQSIRPGETTLAHENCSTI